MTRRIRYANQLAISLFDLQDQKEAMIEQSQLALAILGSSTEIDGFYCNPSISPDLNVNLSSGTLFSYQNVDNTPFGTLPTQIAADTTDQILKLAYQLPKTILPFVPPTTVGFSRNDLIQISFLEVDNTPTSVPFYSGVGLPPVFQTVNVLRSDIAVVSVVTGIAAATGTQTTPSPTGGATGMWVITTHQGQTAITSGDIAMYPGSPFILEKLKDKISQATADTRYVSKEQFQYNAPTYCLAGGTANALTADLDPDVTFYAAGLHVDIQIVSLNTGPVTLNVNGIGAVAVNDQYGQPLVKGDLSPGMIAKIDHNGVNFILSNRATGINVAVVGSTYVSTPQTITNLATKLLFDTVEYDTNGLWNATNKRWDISTSGYYEFVASCVVTGAVTSNPALMLYKNGVLYKVLNQIPGSGAVAAINGSQKIACTAGDYVEIYGSYGGGGTPSFANGASTTQMASSSFQIEYLGE